MNKVYIKELKGIGPKKEALYNKMGIFTVDDLLRFYPSTYEDMREAKPIGSLKEDDNALIFVKVVLVTQDKNNRYRKSPLRLLVQDNTGKIEVVFFNALYLRNTLRVGDEIYLFGRVSQHGGRLEMIHPQIIKKNEFQKGIVPVYNVAKGISQNEIRKLIKARIDEDIKEYLPEDLVLQRNIAPIKFQLQNIHFPKDREHLKVAKYRQVYEELFVMQLGLEMMKTKNNQGISMEGDCTEFVKSFGFELTVGQKKAVEDILNDMSKTEPMNRLLQGDVGSGKTAVASIALYKALINGYQGAFMAPTEILAKQHFESLRDQFEAFGYKVGLLVGGMKQAEKKQALKAIVTGEYDIVIGTHALIQEKVEFKNLGLVITDEQHRFGVNQRFKLGQKGAEPHVLVMTATPIPRTLAVILYGDLDMSVIDTLPQGRKEIITKEVTDKTRLKVYDELIAEIKEGSQVYVVAPLIEESEALEGVKSVEALYEELAAFYKPFDICIGVIHGGLKQDEKDKIMEDFYNKKIDMLIATVVIEVGINVPNATVMVIENAERFGLAQLHQLRGRVGRGKKQSYCYLVNNSKGDIAKKRIKTMCDSTDGFYISEEDLKLRGPGEVFGIRQHGIPDVSLINAIKHIDILEIAKKDAKKYAGNIDENLRHLVEKMYGENISIQL